MVASSRGFRLGNIIAFNKTMKTTSKSEPGEIVKGKQNQYILQWLFQSQDLNPTENLFSSGGFGYSNITSNHEWCYYIWLCGWTSNERDIVVYSSKRPEEVLQSVEGQAAVMVRTLTDRNFRTLSFLHGPCVRGPARSQPGGLYDHWEVV